MGRHPTKSGHGAEDAVCQAVPIQVVLNARLLAVCDRHADLREAKKVNGLYHFYQLE